MLIHYITNLLNIQDNIELINCEIIDNKYHIVLLLSNISNEICPYCKSNRFNIHAKKERVIKHINIGDKPVIITLKYPRLLCMNCKKTFNPIIKFVEKGRRLSNELLESTLNKVKRKESLKDISQDANISETTVINEIKKQLHVYRCKLTETICIDEFKASTIAGTYALIIGDPVSGKILDVLPTRTQDYITYYLQSINKEEISKVKYVVTDLNEAYRTIIKTYYSHSIHIADRFHVAKLVATAFNSIRIKIMNYYHKASEDKSLTNWIKYKRYYELLKKNGRLLMSNRASNPSWYYDKIVKINKLTGEVTTLQDVIEECVNINDELEAAYSLLQDFYRLFKYSNQDNAKVKIENWCEKVNECEERIYEFKHLTLTIKSWIKEICNSFILNPITHQRMSNGFIEGKNNFVKVIKRVGFGYKDFDLFRIRILEADRKDK